MLAGGVTLACTAVLSPIVCQYGLMNVINMYFLLLMAWPGCNHFLVNRFIV